MRAWVRIPFTAVSKLGQLRSLHFASARMATDNDENMWVNMLRAVIAAEKLIDVKMNRSARGRRVKCFKRSNRLDTALYNHVSQPLLHTSPGDIYQTLSSTLPGFLIIPVCTIV